MMEAIESIMNTKNIAAKPPIAAIIWLSVRDEINIPMEIREPPKRIIPKRLPKKIFHCGVAIEERIRKYRIVMAIPIPNSANAARNFPQTMPFKETGAVNSAWSVFKRLSSLISRMVKSGMVNIKTVNILEKTVPMLFVMLYSTAEKNCPPKK